MPNSAHLQLKWNEIFKVLGSEFSDRSGMVAQLHSHASVQYKVVSPKESPKMLMSRNEFVGLQIM